MILGSGFSIQNKIQSYLRYGLHIAKKTEVNKRLTNHDNYKQKMIEKYLDRSREIKNSGLYKMIRGADGQKQLLYFDRNQKMSPMIGQHDEFLDLQNRLNFSKQKTQEKKTVPPTYRNRTADSAALRPHLAKDKMDIKIDKKQIIKEKQIRKYQSFRSEVKHGTDSERLQSKEDKSVQNKKEDLRIKRQKILNEMAEARGDAGKLYDLNIRFSVVENELRTKERL